MDKQINLAVCYFLMTVSSLTLLMPVPPVWLSIGPAGDDEDGKVDTRGREGERNERTISQIIRKDYRGFSQITLSTEGETEIRRLEKG